MSDRSKEPSLSSHPAASPEGSSNKTRTILSIVLVVVASVGVVVVAVAFWLRATVLDTDRFVNLVEPALMSEEFAVAVGTFVGDEVVSALGVQERLETELGKVDNYLGAGLADALDLGPAARRLLTNTDIPSLAAFADPLAAAMEREIESITEAFVRSDAFQTAVPAGIAVAHRAAVALIRDGTRADDVQIVDGEVRWNLLPVVAATVRQVLAEGGAALGLEGAQIPDLSADGRATDGVAKLSQALGVQLPDDFGQVTVVSATKLRNWQATARRLNQLAWLLLAVTVAAIAAAVWVSPRRRRTVVQLAFGSTLALMLGDLVREAGANAVEGAIKEPDARDAVRLVLDQVLSGLRGATFALVGTAAIIGLVAYLVGRPARLQHVRSGGSPDEPVSPATALVVGHADAMRALGFIAALAIWAFAGLGAWSIITVAILLGAYLGFIAYQEARSPMGDHTLAGRDPP